MMKLTSSCANCFNNLSTQARIEIVNLLQERGRMSVLEIAKEFKLTQPTITHHLQHLKQAGILSCQKQGRKVFYFLDPQCSRKECHVLV